jgi:hypothetical protein
MHPRLRISNVAQGRAASVGLEQAKMARIEWEEDGEGVDLWTLGFSRQSTPRRQKRTAGLVHVVLSVQLGLANRRSGALTKQTGGVVMVEQRSKALSVNYKDNTPLILLP